LHESFVGVLEAYIIGHASMGAVAYLLINKKYAIDLKINCYATMPKLLQAANSALRPKSNAINDDLCC